MVWRVEGEKDIGDISWEGEGSSDATRIAQQVRLPTTSNWMVVSAVSMPWFSPGAAVWFNTICMCLRETEIFWLITKVEVDT